MNDLREKIRLISGTLPTTYIDEIISLCMDEAIQAINNVGLSADDNAAAKVVINDIKERPASYK